MSNKEVSPVGPFYYNDNGVQSGPITTDELRKKFKEKKVILQTFIWCQGMTEWKSIEQVFPDWNISPLKKFLKILSLLLFPLYKLLLAPLFHFIKAKLTDPDPKKRAITLGILGVILIFLVFFLIILPIIIK